MNIYKNTSLKLNVSNIHYSLVTSLTYTHDKRKKESQIMNNC